MVAEVEAVRQSVDEDRKRLAERCAALDRDKKAADKAAREEMERLAEQVLKPLHWESRLARCGDACTLDSVMA